MEHREDAETAQILAGTDQGQSPIDSAVPAGKMVSRAEAARLLGVSKSTLRRMEGDALTPVVGPKNVRLFRQDEIQSMVITRRSVLGSSGQAMGEVAAEVFALFDEDVHPVEVVKRLRLDPDLLESLYQRWCKLRGMLVVSDNGATALHSMLCDDESVPRPANETELLSMARKWVQEQSCRRSERCRTEDAMFCRACAKAWGRHAARSEIAEARRRQI